MNGYLSEINQKKTDHVLSCRHHADNKEQAIKYTNNPMKSENKQSKNAAPTASINIERLNQALPALVKPENRQRMSSEKAYAYYGRLESFRRACEARTVLRWIADAYFGSPQHSSDCRRDDHSVTCYFAEVSSKRSAEAAVTLKNDVLALYRAVIETDPSLQELLQSQIKLLK